VNKFSYIRGKNQTFQHPAHSRRFPRYARRAAVDFSDYIISQDFGELNILSPAADVTFWRREVTNNNRKIIFDANDPFLLATDSSLKDKLRGTFKFFSGRQKYLELSYKTSYSKLCELADLVIVGHHAQYELLKARAKRVVFIPDYGIDIPIQVKTDFQLSNNKTVNIFWEGLGSSFMPFELIEKIFIPISKEYDFVFHFVTDLSFYKYGDLVKRVHIQDLAKKCAPSLYKQFKFYQWSEYMMNKIAVACDFAVIPLPDDDSMNFWKPENKLIHMWRMSLPTITSPIPSYVKVFDEAGHKLCPNNFNEWRECILNLCGSTSDRRQYGLAGNSHANQFYSNDAIDDLWQKSLGNL
tara:strand:+ start:4519 stop:5580 length:1062 start_codon:yes stop_codon:yes gene_type:complete